MQLGRLHKKWLWHLGYCHCPPETVQDASQVLIFIDVSGCQWWILKTYIFNEISKILKKSYCQSTLTLKLTKRMFFQSLEMTTRGDMFIHVHRNNFSPLTFWPILQTNVRPLAPTECCSFAFNPQTSGKRNFTELKYEDTNWNCICCWKDVLRHIT